jgi:hypothetical protein
MSSKTAVQIEITVYQHKVTGEFFEDDDLVVVEDGYNDCGEEVPRMIVECSLVDALNSLHRKNIELQRRLDNMGDDGK